MNVKYYSGKFDAYQRTYIIESINKEKLNTKYLYYFLDSYLEMLREQSIGGVIKYIKLGYLTDAMIPLPPLPIQQKIADVLDRASALIEKRKAQIDKLDLLIKSQFIEMFGDPVTNPMGWTKKPFLDTGICKNGLNYNSQEKGIDILCLGVAAFQNRSVIYTVDQLTTISINHMPNDDYLLNDGDIVFVRSNGNKELVGRCVSCLYTEYASNIQRLLHSLSKNRYAITHSIFTSST